MILPWQCLSAQTDQIRYSGSFNNLPVREVFSIIEKQYGIRFLYADKTIDNVMITDEFVDLPLSECIGRLLKNTQYGYYISGKSTIVIFPGKKLADIFPGFVQQATEERKQASVKKISREELQQLQFRMIDIGVPGNIRSALSVLSGYVTNYDSGEPVAGAGVFASQLQKGVTTDQKGYYKITLPSGNHILSFSSTGMQPVSRNINLYSDGNLDVLMEVKLNLLDEAVIHGKGESRMGKLHIGMENIDIRSIKVMPALLGEADIVKSILALPGVQTVGEGSAGFNVRGGNTDQNLILLDRATMYYPSHFFGNFSAVGSEIIENATLYKGNIPVRYGGRISSVLDINSREGNADKLAGSAGISPIFGRINIDGPLFSDKATFLASFRSTYSDWLLGRINVPELYQSSAGFHDLQTKLSFHIDPKNELQLNFYSSSDRFRLHSDTAYRYRNIMGSAALKHKFNSGLNSTTSLIWSMFDYKITNLRSEESGFNLTHYLSNLSLVNDLEYLTSSGIKFNYGAELNFYSVNPGERTAPAGSNIIPFRSMDEHALEYGLYAGAEFNITGNLKLVPGIRMSGLLSFDDGKRYIYAAGMPYQAESIIDTLFTGRNKVQKFYANPEWRISLNYTPGRNTALKFSYNRTAQYLHMLSNTTAVSPTDTWKLSDKYILPSTGNQFSAGWFRNLSGSKGELSAELFFKSIDNIKQYKAGADLLLNDHPETEIVNGHAKSYGLELAAEKSSGRLTGRLDYTYSRTFIKSVSRFREVLINSGEYYPANFDRPNNFNLQATYKASRRLVLSTALYYSTGRPITYPVSQYKLGDNVFLQYSKYNQYRLSDYFRTDLSITLNSGLKRKKHFRDSFTFSLYNVTSRKNAYSVYFRSEGGKFSAYQLSVFGTIIPTVIYNIDFK
jgi:hypothetical protein